MKPTKFASCLLLFFPSFLIAQPANYNKSLTTGFYGSLMLGANIASGQWAGSNTLSVSNNEDKSQGISQTLSFSGSANTTVFVGRILGGYQLVRENLLLATEIGGNFSNNAELTKHLSTAISNSIPDNGKTQIVSGTATTNTIATLSGNNLYIDVKPGLLIKPIFLLYGRAGLAFLDKLSISDTGSWTQQGVITGAPNIAPLQASGISDKSNNNVMSRRI